MALIYIKYIMKNYLLICICVYANISLAAINDDSITKNKIIQKKNDWFYYLSEKVITEIPEKGSDIAEWDKKVSNDYRHIQGERLKLAIADKSQSPLYVYNSFINSVLIPNQKDTLFNKDNDNAFNKLSNLYKSATYVLDPYQKRERSIDFILKDYFWRGRPYQVIDKNGNYKDNYTDILGSSFPSGHTWNGYRQAVILSIIFPERGGEIFNRAVEYGESRVIVGAHFGTDTIASRIGNYFILAQLLSDDDITNTFISLAKDVRHKISDKCNGDINHCLKKRQKSYDFKAGYYEQNNNLAVNNTTPNDIPDTASYLLRLRFPYLTNHQRKSILASTSYPTNSLAGWEASKDIPDKNWGLINLPNAYDGPVYLYESFIVNQNINNHNNDIYNFSKFDEWKNDISGDSPIIKNGSGTLVLRGNDSFKGIELNAGTLIISGDTRYKDKSIINGGTLVVDGTLNSALDINSHGQLIANGTINSTINN